MKNLPVNIRAAALVLLSFLSYTIADSFLKYTVEFYSFAEAALYPVIFYAIFMVIFSKKFGGLQPLIQTQKVKYHIIRSGFGTGCFLCIVYAFTTITFAEAYTLLLTAPFWIALLSIFYFKESIGWHRWLAIATGFVGVLVILRPGIIDVQPASIAALAAAGFFSIFVIYTKKIGAKEPLINMVMFPIVSDIIILIPIILFMGNWHPPQLEHFIYFALSGAFYIAGTTFSSLGYSSGVSSVVAPMQYSQILWGILLGFLFFNEIPEDWTLAGSAIIVLSGVYLIYREHLAHQETKAP